MIAQNNAIFRISRQLQKLNYKRSVQRALKNNKEAMEDLLRDQMRSGQDADGMMDIYRSLEYAEEKRGRASYRAQYPHRDLFDTGSFQRGIFMTQNASQFIFNSRDPYFSFNYCSWMNSFNLRNFWYHYSMPFYQW